MIIVTGANGFIGSVLVRDLNARGLTDIICVDSAELKERPDLLKKAKFEKFLTTAQMLDWMESDEATGGGPYAVRGIFHMGAISSTTETDWEKLQKNNIELSQNLFRYATRFSIPYIYASSGAVYGGGEKGFSDSIAPGEYKPLNLYGTSKRDFDVWALEQKKAPPRWIGLRFFNVYGPNEYHKGEMASVVYKAYLQIKATGSLKLFRSHNPEYKDGEQLRDFIYVKDVTRWMCEIFESKKFPSGIYNMGYGQARTWLDLARAVFKVMDQPENIDWIEIPQRIRNQYQYFTEADMKKSFAAGLSRPQFSLEEGVADYLKKHLLTEDPYV